MSNSALAQNTPEWREKELLSLASVYSELSYALLALNLETAIGVRNSAHRQ